MQKYPPKDVWECEIEAEIDVERDMSCHDSSECPSKCEYKINIAKSSTLYNLASSLLIFLNLHPYKGPTEKLQAVTNNTTTPSDTANSTEEMNLENTTSFVSIEVIGPTTTLQSENNETAKPTDTTNSTREAAVGNTTSFAPTGNHLLKYTS